MCVCVIVFGFPSQKEFLAAYVQKAISVMKVQFSCSRSHFNITYCSICAPQCVCRVQANGEYSDHSVRTLYRAAETAG